MASPGSVLASGGSSIVQAMQGIVASFAKSTVMGQLYAGVALVELAAGLTGNLAFAGIFNLGLGLDSMTGLGLPFFVSTISLSLIFFASTKSALQHSKVSCCIKLTHAPQILFALTFGIPFFLPTRQEVTRSS